MQADLVVDRFVAALQRDGHHIEVAESTPWISALEERLPRRFPASFASLVYRYRFAPFDRGGIRFFGNMGDGSEEELVVAMHKDPGLSTPTLSLGLLQVGRPDTGQYDPVCLDGRGMKNRKEYPLVILDHEALLQFERVVVIKECADSFLRFMLHNGAAA